LVVIMSLLVIYQPNSINNANANDNVWLENNKVTYP
jgi:hypothetical protein